MSPTQRHIQQLRSEGWQIWIRHWRYVSEAPGSLIPARIAREGKLAIEPLGGVVECTLRTPDGRETSSQALCSRKDNFNKRRGLMIAFGRAIKGLA